MKTLLASITVFLLVASFIAVIVFFWGSNRNWLMNTLNGPNYERWVGQFDAYGVAEGDVVFLGDSITEWGSWHELFPGVPVRNRGIAGDDTKGVLRRLDSIVSGKPAKVFLLIGTNDLFGGVPEQTIVDNIVKIIDRLHSDSPNTELYVQSILPRRPSYTRKIQSINPKIEAAIQGKAEWIDLFPLFLSDDGSRIDPELSNDKLHLTAQGFLLWRDTIYDKVVAGGLTKH